MTRPTLALGVIVTGLIPLAAAPAAEIVAHRGASHDAPENTLAAFRLAWEQGADAIEGDFHLSKDGHIVCIHDKTTKRTAGVDLAVAATPLAELRKLDVGSWKGEQWKGERIPLLEEVLATVPAGKKIFVEVKCGPEIIGPLKKVLARSKLRPEQVTIISFGEAVIAAAKRELPYLKAYWLTSFKEDKQTGEWKPTPEQVFRTLARTRADGLDCNAHECVGPEFVAGLRRAGMEFHVWTVDDPKVAGRFLELGAASITTNRPGWLREKVPALRRAER